MKPEEKVKGWDTLTKRRIESQVGLLTCKGCGLPCLACGTFSWDSGEAETFNFCCQLRLNIHQKRWSQCVGKGAGSTTREGAVEEWNSRQLKGESP